jgi:predicted ester cyclase
VAEEDKVWHHFKTTRTHKGEFRRLAPTGKKVTWTGVNFWKIVDSKVIEKGSIYDMLDTLKQLGVIEYSEKAKAFLP